MALVTGGKPYQPGDFYVGVDDDGNDVGVTSERHAITIAGSGSGKGVSIIVPNLLRWPHNALVIDPKGENAELTYAKRQEMGQAVYVLDPFRSAEVPENVRANFNPLTTIDLTSNRARSSILAIANGLVVVHDPKHMEWTAGARSILAGIIAFVVADAPPDQRTFAEVRELLMQPNGKPATADEQPSGLYADAIQMANDSSVGGLIRDAGIMLMTAIETDRGMEKDFLGLARRATAWLDDEAISECLNGTSFDLKELKTGKATIYVVLPADGDFMTDYSGFLRLFVKTALTIMGTSQQGERCLFLLDEFSSLGRLEEVAEAAGRMRSYGVQLWPFMQDLGQLLRLYGGEGAQTFFSNADLHLFFGNSDPLTLNEVSTRIGIIGLDEMPAAPNAPTQMNVGAGNMISSMTSGSRSSSARMTGALTGGVLSGIGGMIAGLEAADYQNKMNEYQRKMSEVGKPRLAPDKVAKFIQKRDTDIVAPNMIAFISGQAPAMIKPQPYFLPPPTKPTPEPPAPSVFDPTTNPALKRPLRHISIFLLCVSALSGFLIVSALLKGGDVEYNIAGIFFIGIASTALGVWLFRKT